MQRVASVFLHGGIGEPALSERVDVAIERGRDGVVVEVPLVALVGRDTHVVAQKLRDGPIMVLAKRR